MLEGVLWELRVQARSTDANQCPLGIVNEVSGACLTVQVDTMAFLGVAGKNSGVLHLEAMMQVPPTPYLSAPRQGHLLS